MNEEIKSLKDPRLLRRVGRPCPVESSMNYDRFVFKKGNRPVRGRVINLIAAIEKKNQLSIYPITVSELGDGKLEIADGQHRFEAARALKVPIFFIRSRQPITIEEIASANQQQKSWNMADWMESWIARGNKDYQVLKEFCDTFRLPITVSMEIIGRTYGGEQNTSFKSGKFQVSNLQFGQTVGHTLGALRGHVPVADLRLVRAIVKVLKVEGVSIDRLIKKLVSHASMFERQGTWMKYVELIEKLYNSHVSTQDRLSLVFAVDQMDRQKRSKGVSNGNKTKAKQRQEEKAAA